MWGIGLGRWVDLEIKKKGRGFGEFDLRAVAEQVYADRLLIETYLDNDNNDHYPLCQYLDYLCITS